ncbi:hypothetical protein FGO68_gene7016 [Halteria grandinella]|uniref:Uncharacterized protein n=1 Tax=Halteria grandinella TaxID=5974 RepID=A0A8J8NKY2_HALGN|nr:hypothetical protein FGO68_gene7016 [Halteria grandinella]
MICLKFSLNEETRAQHWGLTRFNQYSTFPVLLEAFSSITSDEKVFESKQKGQQNPGLEGTRNCLAEQVIYCKQRGIQDLQNLLESY